MNCSHAIRGSVASLQSIRYASKYQLGFLNNHAANVRPTAAWTAQIPNDASEMSRTRRSREVNKDSQATSAEERRRCLPNRSQAAPFCSVFSFEHKNVALQTSAFGTRLSRRPLFSRRVTSLIKKTTEQRERERDG